MWSNILAILSHVPLIICCFILGVLNRKSPRVPYPFAIWYGGRMFPGLTVMFQAQIGCCRNKVPMWGTYYWLFPSGMQVRNLDTRCAHTVLCTWLQVIVHYHLQPGRCKYDNRYGRSGYFILVGNIRVGTRKEGVDVFDVLKYESLRSLYIDKFHN